MIIRIKVESTTPNLDLKSIFDTKMMSRICSKEVRTCARDGSKFYVSVSFDLANKPLLVQETSPTVGLENKI